MTLSSLIWTGKEGCSSPSKFVRPLVWPQGFPSFPKLVQSGHYRQIFCNSLNIWYMFDRTQLIDTRNILKYISKYVHDLQQLSLQYLLQSDKLLMSLRTLVQSGDTDTSFYSLFVGLVVRSSLVDLTQIYKLYNLFLPGQPPWYWSTYTVIVLYMMADPWPGPDENLLD